MTRRVIFPPPDYWTSPPQPEPEETMTTYIANGEAALAIVGALDAHARRDDEGAALLLYPWHKSGQTDQLLGAAFSLLDHYVNEYATLADIDPAAERDHLRRQLLDALAAE
jgi:hypothetical protein